MKRMSLIILSIFICLVPIGAVAGTYYVSNGATESWVEAKNRNTPCSYETANKNALPSDTVIYINDGGKFYAQYQGFINPINSGVEGSPITFKGEDGQEVIVEARIWGAKLIDRSYIVIDNLTFRNVGGNSWVYLRNKNTGTTSHHITIRNCTFEVMSSQWGGIFADGNNHHIYIQNNIIKGGVATGKGMADAVYFTPNSGYRISHILIEGNDIEGGCHNALEFQTYEGTIEYVIIRNNSIHNPNHTSLNLYGVGTRPQYVLVENNRLYDAGSICGVSSCPDNICGSEQDRSWPRENHPNLQWSAHYGMVRNNMFYNGGRGFDVQNTAEHNRIYHNVLYNNVQGVNLNTSQKVAGNIFVNNIFIDNNLNGVSPNHPIEVDSLPNSPCDNEWRYNNFDESNNILYKACNGIYGSIALDFLESKLPSVWHNNSELDSGFENKAEYDFRLKNTSPLIDAGHWLTTTTGAGNDSSKIVVEDAHYFMDGWGLIEGDLIQLEGQSQRVRIINVNYATNTITIDQNISWSDNQGVTLAYDGSAPDIGAYEFADSSVPLPPSGLEIVQ